MSGTPGKDSRILEVGVISNGNGYLLSSVQLSSPAWFPSQWSTAQIRVDPFRAIMFKLSKRTLAQHSPAWTPSFSPLLAYFVDLLSSPAPVSGI